MFFYLINIYRYSLFVAISSDSYIFFLKKGIIQSIAVRVAEEKRAVPIIIFAKTPNDYVDSVWQFKQLGFTVWYKITLAIEKASRLAKEKNTDSSSQGMKKAAFSVGVQVCFPSPFFVRL